MSKVAFISVAIHFAKYQLEIGNRLKSKGVEIDYITYSKECYNFLKKNGQEVYYIPDMKSKFNKLGNDIALGAFEMTYGFKREDILFGDYDYSFKSKNYAYKCMARDFFFWKDYVTKKKPDIIIGSSERYVGLIPYYVCKGTNTKFYFWSRNPMPGRWWMSTQTLSGRVTNIENYWRDNRDRELTEPERNRAEQIIDHVTGKKVTNYLVIGEPGVDSNLVKIFFDRLLKNIFIEKLRNPYARVVGIASERVARIFRSKKSKAYYKTIDYNEKYIFYPLQATDDCQVLVRAPKYYDQRELLMTLSKYCLEYAPETKIVVKEHPNYIGALDPKIVKEISEMPNVIVVAPQTSSHDLISNARTILTLNSMVGWEAILYRKPIVTMAPCFYDCYDEVIQCHKLSNLGECMLSATLLKELDKEKSLRFINAVYEGSYAGSFNFFPGKEADSMRPENLDLIADGVLTEVNKP